MFSIITEITQFAPTQSTVMNFNSYGNLGEQYLAANENGIYSICECNDADGSDIDGYFRIIKTDFGSSKQKVLNTIYVGYESEGSLFLKITIDDDYSRIFTMPPVRIDMKQHGNEIPLTEDLEGRYFDFKVGNIGGGDFSVDLLDLNITILGFKPVGTSF